MSFRSTTTTAGQQQSWTSIGSLVAAAVSSISWRSYSDIRPHHVLVVWVAGSHLCSAVSRSTVWTRGTNAVVATAVEAVLPLIQNGLVPDWVIRWGIRCQLSAHLRQLRLGTDKTTTTSSNNTSSSSTTSSSSSSISNTSRIESQHAAKMQVVADLTVMPIAIETAAANDQHYEVPAAFYDLCLGPCKKYSSGLWNTKTTTFADSELAMLALYCQRAGVVNGMRIVDLGCGWGSLTLYLAQHYPDCTITAISNSHSQRDYILQTALERGLLNEKRDNINVVTCNVSDDQGALSVVKDNDLVITVEMFEHMKNYQQLLSKVHGFLKPTTGRLFVHIFTHKDFTYHFNKGWMSDNFFSGGTMPSDDLLLYFATDFSVLQHWRVNGTHYEKTSNAWLQTMDHHWKDGSLRPVLASAYGAGREREWYINWRLFFLACAELWGYDSGEEWIVSHYLFQCR